LERIFGRKPETRYSFESNPLFSKYNSGTLLMLLPAPKELQKPTIKFLKTVLQEIKGI
jgi:hypothetical protein